MTDIQQIQEPFAPEDYDTAAEILKDRRKWRKSSYGYSLDNEGIIDYGTYCAVGALRKSYFERTGVFNWGRCASCQNYEHDNTCHQTLPPMNDLPTTDHLKVVDRLIDISKHLRNQGE